ncbi:Methyltransferase type 12 [Thermobaculum terrenum ATCC BAA-798]|uniref:Methyltransferase type 12 n=1 Tax=Thermobaculum terrenum (strain ATCC BAA-798 / CCMEE 7001 / YNP1) TaxID=525904 RepID=D1CBB8_THET1|nr:class I SAM-dependent methyltransferase [Thermobaculum terrenum]ACZ42083.1 Methyltransferase type 12 [Thermobaculum terrenum ATCC BAA-798]
MSSGYATRFQTEEAVKEYEQVEYSPNSYSAKIWSLQKPIVLRLIEDFASTRKESRLLDFACGTGRILSTVEPLVSESVGLDISPSMIKIAASKCKRSELIVGDILQNPDLVDDQFDIITCFRFLLNAESQTRIDVLRVLRSKLVSRNGILVANVHGNSWSARHLALLYRKWVKGEIHNEMSPPEITRMFHAAGFKIVRYYGFGIIPPTLYRTPLAPMAFKVDSIARDIHILRSISVDLLYVCVPA